MLARITIRRPARVSGWRAAASSRAPKPAAASCATEATTRKRSPSSRASRSPGPRQPSSRAPVTASSASPAASPSASFTAWNRSRSTRKSARPASGRLRAVSISRCAAARGSTASRIGAGAAPRGAAAAARLARAAATKGSAIAAASSSAATSRGFAGSPPSPRERGTRAPSRRRRAPVGAAPTPFLGAERAGAESGPDPGGRAPPRARAPPSRQSRAPPAAGPKAPSSAAWASAVAPGATASRSLSSAASAA